MKLIFLILTFFISSCKETLTGNKHFNIGEEFEIRFNEKQYSSDSLIIVQFDSLLYDSRCPIGVKCVWEGEAKIKLKIVNEFTQECFLTISGYVSREHTNRHQSVICMGYLITLLQLDPYPVYGTSVDLSYYKAIVRIDRKER